MSTHKDTVRFSFDCPSELHVMAKTRAALSKQSMRDYVVGLLVKDAVEHPPRFLNDEQFKKELEKILTKHDGLMRILANK